MNILIVEDHPLISLSYKQLIQNRIEKVYFFEANNLTEAIKHISENKFSIAIVDLNLKGESGLNVIKLIKTKQPKCKIIVVSLYEEIETVWFCKKMGANAFLTKTSEEKIFINILKQVIDSKEDEFITTLELQEKLSYLLYEDINYFFEEFSKLTNKEKMVLKLKLHNYKNSDIAEILEIKPKTVENHISRISTKCIPNKYNFHEFIEKYKNTLTFIVSL